jgi:hypothetical protein
MFVINTIMYNCIYWQLDIFTLISPSDIVSISYVKRIMTLTIKAIASVLKVSTYIITSRPIGLAAILVTMSVSTIITAVILYLFYWVSGSGYRKGLQCWCLRTCLLLIFSSRKPFILVSSY